MATVGYTGARHDAENGITEPITPSPLTAVRPSRARRPGEAAVKGVLSPHLRHGDPWLPGGVPWASLRDSSPAGMSLSRGPSDSGAGGQRAVGGVLG